MKKLALILLLFMPIVSMAKGNEKTFLKLINKYDVDSTCLSAKNAGAFWDGVWRHNVRFNKFMEAVKKSTTATNKAFRMLAEAKKLNHNIARGYEIVATDKDSLMMPLYNELGAGKVTNNIKILLIYDKTFNACATPDGEIYLNTGILDDSLGFASILGICAHEMAHYLLQHAYVRSYEVAKRENKNKVIAAIASGVSVASSAYAAANGAQEDWDKINEEIKNLAISALVDADRFGFKYSREQEIEADIIAFRFLDTMGYGGVNYIKALEKIEEKYPETNLTSDTDNHPSTAFRIELLNYMMKRANANNN